MKSNKLTEEMMTELCSFSIGTLDAVENMAWKKFQSMCQWAKWTPNPPQWGFFAIIKESKEFLIMDPRFEDEALSALMEEAFSQTEEETKFDVDAYFNSDIDY